MGRIRLSLIFYTCHYRAYELFCMFLQSSVRVLYKVERLRCSCSTYMSDNADTDVAFWVCPERFLHCVTLSLYITVWMLVIRARQEQLSRITILHRLRLILKALC